MKGKMFFKNKKAVSAILAAALLVTSVSTGAISVNAEPEATEEAATQEQVEKTTVDYEGLSSALSTAETQLADAKTKVAGIKNAKTVSGYLADAEASLKEAAAEDDKIAEFLGESTLVDKVSAITSELETVVSDINDDIKSAKSYIEELEQLKADVETATTQDEIDEIRSKAEVAYKNCIEALKSAYSKSGALDEALAKFDALQTILAGADAMDEDMADAYDAVVNARKALGDLYDISDEEVDEDYAELVTAYYAMVAEKVYKTYNGSVAETAEDDAVFGVENASKAYWNAADKYFNLYLNYYFKDKEDLKVTDAFVQDKTGYDYAKEVSKAAGKTDNLAVQTYGNSVTVSYTEDGQTVERQFNYHIADKNGNISIVEKYTLDEVEYAEAIPAAYGYLLEGNADVVYSGDATNGIEVSKNNNADLYAADRKLSEVNKNLNVPGWNYSISGESTTYDLGTVTVPDTYGTKNVQVGSDSVSGWKSTEKMQNKVYGFLNGKDESYFAEVTYKFMWTEKTVTITPNGWDRFWRNFGTTLLGWTGTVSYKIKYYHVETDYTKVTGTHTEDGIVGTTKATVTYTRNESKSDNDYSSYESALNAGNAWVAGHNNTITAKNVTVTSYTTGALFWKKTRYKYNASVSLQDVKRNVVTKQQPYTAKHYTYGLVSEEVPEVAAKPARLTETNAGIYDYGTEDYEEILVDYDRVNKILAKKSLLQLEDILAVDYVGPSEDALTALTEAQAEALKTQFAAFGTDENQKPVADSIVDLKRQADELIDAIMNSDDISIANDANLVVTMLDDLVYTGLEQEAVTDVTFTRNGETVSLYPLACQVSYFNNINAGTADVTIFFDDQSVWHGTFDIASATVSALSFDTIADQTYDGTAKTPAVTFAEMNKYVAGKDYDVAYTNNTDAGTATVTYTFKGNYKGTVTTTFKIVAPAPAPALPVAEPIVPAQAGPAPAQAGPAVAADNNNNIEDAETPLTPAEVNADANANKGEGKNITDEETPLAFETAESKIDLMNWLWLLILVIVAATVGGVIYTKKKNQNAAK